MTSKREQIRKILHVTGWATAAALTRKSGLRHKDVSTALSSMVLRDKSVQRRKSPGSYYEYSLSCEPTNSLRPPKDIELKLALLRSVKTKNPHTLLAEIVADYEHFLKIS